MDRFTVLIIEDDEVAAEIIQKMVLHTAPDSRTEWCWNGYEALVRVKAFEPDLIFLDYMMPKIDGLAFLRDLRRLDPATDCQVAVVSAYVDETKQQEFVEAGADFVLAKPVTAEQIARIVDKVAKQAKRLRKK
jgi:CheY-like chemotaxis protein